MRAGRAGHMRCRRASGRKCYTYRSSNVLLAAKTNQEKSGVEGGVDGGQGEGWKLTQGEPI